MKFYDYITEKGKYGMKLAVLRKVFKSQFDNIKSPAALDDLYGSFVKQLEHWSYGDDEYAWLDSIIKSTAKRLHFNKNYKSLKDQAPKKELQ